ncbi:hypothetical protein [Sphingosinicella sp. BN140058]|uniref:hypothetical protein n=1 Tax=Sphingosinicella sp. BN140058 TaxID=1892855 RepID=UPI0010118AE1|nr:hypothetical protein [Sphingosinicella sp. BN140058]QAY80351.1 hypothetical protein ETR14_27295 [Sphingosinicella sp. BN140058]
MTDRISENSREDLLERVDAVYEVTMRVTVTANLAAGVPDRDTLVALVNERGLHADDIDSTHLLEVRVDDAVVAAAF